MLGTAAVSTSATSIAWTDTGATNIALRYYRVGVAGIDGDEDGYSDAREELMYHSDPRNAASHPVTVSGSVTHADTPQTTYWARAWIDADADGAFDVDREASGAWTNNPFLLSNSVWDVDITLDDVDADTDGLPDWWEFANFGTLSQTALGDYDADAMPNLWEYTWNFCPDRKSVV